MPATVSTHYLSLPDLERNVRAGVEEFFNKCPDFWNVSILGAQTNDAWELKVKAPDGGESVRMLYGHDGGHRVERVLKVLEQITAELHPIKS